MEEQLLELQHQYTLTDCFIERSELMGQIEDIEVRLGKRVPPKPPESPYLCEGCSS